MKKISKFITLILALCMVFSTAAFAADSEMPVTQISDVQKYVSDRAGEAGMESREPAAPITSATITDILQDTATGRVYAVVEVAGYGYAYGYIDGAKVKLDSSTPVGSPIVTGFIYVFDCGVLSSGSHTFRYSGTSYNRPWNTVDRQVTFPVP